MRWFLAILCSLLIVIFGQLPILVLMPNSGGFLLGQVPLLAIAFLIGRMIVRRKKVAKSTTPPEASSNTSTPLAETRSEAVSSAFVRAAAQASAARDLQTHEESASPIVPTKLPPERPPGVAEPEPIQGQGQMRPAQMDGTLVAAIALGIGIFIAGVYAEQYIFPLGDGVAQFGYFLVLLLAALFPAIRLFDRAHGTVPRKPGYTPGPKTIMAAAAVAIIVVFITLDNWNASQVKELVRGFIAEQTKDSGVQLAVTDVQVPFNSLFSSGYRVVATIEDANNPTGDLKFLRPTVDGNCLWGKCVVSARRIELMSLTRD
jgi:hypothetical protein